MTFSIFKKIAEERIRKAMEEGLFDNLEYKGKPIELKEDPFVPEDLKVVYRILKNAGFLPKEVELRKEIYKLEELLDEEVGDAYLKVRKLTTLIFQLSQIRKGPVSLEESEYYYKIAEKVKLAKHQLPNKESKEIDWAKLQSQLYISALKSRRKK
ncbi:MAG: DUF1992 domain-containing protein [Thermodesulfobacterium geofontis]|uniref:DUF1992 domain-containing protein n=1 Tax=Thermodesulfobacterium geofontis TaxID=1295609 RepID=A0A2N7PMH7_9BACT|nr:MAG: DUF1992 domain-containing protein [Thermodesulfobacterium geofontis]PMP97815.1 MAG: DUF1992 domain-containing protein [Thermodesulfobacterium geofontis]